MRAERKIALGLACAFACGACAGEAEWEPPVETEAAAVPASSPDAGAVVDTVLPMDVMLARFRAGLSDPTRLEHGAETRDALVARIVSALQASDSAAFEAIAVDRAEFAWLYFPTAPIARPPYEVPPGLAWFRIQEGNRKGVFRALREFGGLRLELLGYRCDSDPRVEGDNRIWVGCTLDLAREGEKLSIRLFESILERDRRFAVLSFANDF
jgi:hypothetical protein